jgi:hypothetical protein
VCYPIPFARWKAELRVDGDVYGVGVGQRPGCAVRDAMNDFCLKHGTMPLEGVRMTIDEWE